MFHCSHVPLLLVVTWFCSGVYGRVWETKVVSVVDGDTFGATTSTNLEQKVHLAGIDAPEGNQPFGPEARQVLSDKILGRKVRITYTFRGYNLPLIAEVSLEGRSINAEMVEEGWVWSKPSEHAPNPFLEFEKKARSSGIGLWKSGDPVPPWKWRASVKSEKTLDDTGMFEQSGDEENTDTVFIGEGSRKYHRSDCRRLRGKTEEITRRQAEKWSHKPCPICKP